MNPIYPYRSSELPSGSAVRVRISGGSIRYLFVIRRGDLVELRNWLFVHAMAPSHEERESKEPCRPRAKKDAHAP